MSPTAVTTSAGATVTVYRPGGVVSGDVTTYTGGGGYFYTDIPLYRGHGFIVGDRIMVGIDTTTYTVVTAVNSTGITALVALTLVTGDTIVNLGADSGANEPSFDGSDIVIYRTPAPGTAIEDSRVTTNEDGEYDYYHDGTQNLWELIRGTDGAPLEIVVGAFELDLDDQSGVRYAHLFATGGTGTEDDPWITSGSNPIQAAYNDLPVSGTGGGGIVRMIPGVYSLDGGPNGNGVEITNATAVYAGVTLEGVSSGNRYNINSPANVYKDGAILLYSGTGAALKLGHWATNRSYWGEHCTFRNFKVVQVGTLHTGIGILTRLLRFSAFDNVIVTGFDTDIAMSGVSDFNYFNSCSARDMGTYGVDIGRSTDENGVAFGALAGECNSNRFYNCDIAAGVRGSGVPAWGIYIHNNSVGCTIRDCEFHDFNTTGGPSLGYGAIRVESLGFDSTSTTIEANYFEGNYYCVYHVNSAGAGRDCQGLHVLNNWTTQTEGACVRVNSGMFPGGYTKGTVIMGNTFYVPSASAPYNNTIGVQLGANVVNTFLAGNTYVVEGPSPTFVPQTYTLPGGNVVSIHRELVEIIDDTIQWRGMYQSKMTEGSNSEEITLSTSGLTTDSSASLLPANSVILGVTARITTTITTATNWALGDSAQAARFTTATTSKTAGYTAVGLNHLNPTVASADLGPVQTSAAPIRVTCTGSNPGAGKIRVTVFYRTFSAATS